VSKYLMTGVAALFSLLVHLFGDSGSAQGSQGVVAEGNARQADDQNATVAAISEEVWNWNLESNYMARVQRGLPIIEIKDITEKQIADDARRAERYISRLNKIKEESLDHDHYVTRAFLLRYLSELALAPRTDPLAFVVTPYNGGLNYTYLFKYAVGAPLNTPELRRDYLAFLHEFADLIEQTEEKTRRQADAGVRLPMKAIPGAVELFTGLKSGAGALIPEKPRLDSVPSEEADAFVKEATSIVNHEIIDAYDRVINIFDEAYVQAAPSAVGLSQYPNGEKVYDILIDRYVNHPYTAREIHEIGLAHMKELNREMASVRAEVGFEGTRAEFHDLLRSDPRFIAKEPADVEARYRLYIGRIEPLIGDYFSYIPKAPYGVKRLDPANEAGQTFGYYQVPTPDEPRGLYRYNGSNLENRSLVNAGPLIYHELIPGHHFHLATQQENSALSELRRSLVSLSMSGFNEGWAEYAAGLGHEMGLYADPYDRYGRLVMSAFLTSRLVVDTGLNSLGWSLEQARTYLLENTMMSEIEVNSETIRYSTDIPGQALAYRLGRDKMDALRAKAEAALGDEFDIKEFHATILGQGALPLDVLESHIDWYIEQQRLDFNP